MVLTPVKVDTLTTLKYKRPLSPKILRGCNQTKRKTQHTSVYWGINGLLACDSATGFSNGTTRYSTVVNEFC
jgi:hypothetical protein